MKANQIVINRRINEKVVHNGEPLLNMKVSQKALIVMQINQMPTTIMKVVASSASGNVNSQIPATRSSKPSASDHPQLWAIRLLIIPYPRLKPPATQIKAAKT